VTARADLLRNDIWDRWRAGARLPPLREPLTDAIGKLADVADRQLALLQQAATVQQPVTIHRPVSEQVDRPIVQARRDPPAALAEQPDVNVGPSLLFSQIEDEYIAIRENGGASAGTIRARHLVCARRDPAARLLRRHLDQLDFGVESQGGRNRIRHLRIPDDRTERRGRRHSPEGDAGDPDKAGRSRDLDDGTSRRRLDRTKRPTHRQAKPPDPSGPPSGGPFPRIMNQRIRSGARRRAN
jgi:hypothetical protein